MIRVTSFQRETRETFPSFKTFSRSHISHYIFDRHIQHLNQSEFVVFEHIWRWEISDSALLTVASSNPVMLAVPQLMYGADSWRAALRCLDLFNPADQPSDRSMCAGNGCQMR